MDWFSDANEETRKGVRAAVNHFLIEEEWPPLSQKEQTFVLLRLDWAVWLANSMMACPGLAAPSMDVPEEFLMRWFLMGSWECAGMAQAMIGLDIAAQSLQGCLAESGDFDDGLTA
jgi:hypothetical protein